jgi:hypothetical protein
METATVSILRRSEPSTEGVSPKRDVARTLTVKGIYILSESGRKASLVTGGTGRAVQEIELDIPTNRLHLVHVDPDGNAYLKLRPRYDVRPDGRVAQIDSPPMFDRPPTNDELLLAAAKNHELERAYVGQGGRRARKREALSDVRARLAETFLSNPELRALVHPPPEPKRCYVDSPNGRVLFDASRDEGVARDVPAEAHRRFRADERARRERNTHERARRIALHEEKMRFAAEWVAANGTPDQQQRQAIGLLPIDEALEAMAVELFAPLRQWPLYIRNGPAVFQAHLRRYPEFERVVITERELDVADADAVQATAAQWARAQEARSMLPDATVMLRSHRLTWRGHPEAPALTLYGLLVVRTIGPFVLRREFAVPQ